MSGLTDKVESFGKDESKGLLSRIRDNINYHLVDSTAINVTVTPIFTIFETSVAGMSDENSLNARTLAVTLNYAGLGRVFSKGLDISRKLFNINPETSEKIKQLHDAVYAVGYCAVLQPPFYYAAGVRNLKEIAIGTAVGMGLALCIGGPVGHTVDSFRDLTGLQKSERVPNFIRKQNSKIKKGIAVALTAASIGLTAGIYKLTPNKTEQYNQPTIQQGVDNISYENKKLNCFNIRNCA